MKPAFFTIPWNDDAKSLRAAAARLGLELLADVNLPADKPVLFYGSIETVKAIQHQNPHLLLDWCNWKKLRCSTYYAHWGPFLLNDNYGFYPITEVKRLKERLFSMYAAWSDNAARIFIRPDANDKVFDGGLVTQLNLESWLKTCTRRDPEELCLVARPVSHIRAEYRLFVANTKVVTGSSYIRHDRLVKDTDIPAGAFNLAEEAAAAWSPHPVFCIDVAEQLIPGALPRFSIIECGSVHTCGIYAADPDIILEAMVQVVAKNQQHHHAKVISGALRSAIDTHGPITRDLIGSATKRVIGSLKGLLNSDRSVVQSDPSQTNEKEQADGPADDDL